jgi:hypothetical protein
VFPAEGGYFLVADCSATGLDAGAHATSAAMTGTVAASLTARSLCCVRLCAGAYCKALIAAARVAAVPMDCFYFDTSAAAPRSLVRFAICKRADTIDAAAAAIRAAPVPLASARAAV